MFHDHTPSFDPELLSPVPEEVLARLRSQEELLQTVAHDLRNPLGGITALSALLLAESCGPPEQDEMLIAIKTAAEQSLRLVESLLAPGSSRQPAIRPQKARLHEVLQNCLRLVQHQLYNKHQQLELDSFEGHDELVIGPEKLARVINNLVANAIKFTPESGTITIVTQPMSGGVQLMVRDNGIGIPEAIRGKLFTGAQEKQRTGTLGEVSYGLGLPICKKIVDSAGGTITCQSKPGKGSIFYVWLPATEDTTPPAP